MSQPRAAIIGASRHRQKFGNKAVRAFARSGWLVYPIHPTEATVEGFVAYPNLDAISESIDLVSLYVPPATGRSLLPAIARKAPREVWLNPGSHDESLVAEAAALGLKTVSCCSLLALGFSPRDFPDIES